MRAAKICLSITARLSPTADTALSLRTISSNSK
ncbi:unnamed protein product [Linum tenue]|uniref:Uncharacterized protein n=1 Tax=Linum tenue TaxID=586396 RepID=A0AAV0HG73_9ROSI|nr:unnamed protein product [Linum tenue]